MARQSLPDAEVPDPGRIAGPQDFGRELTLARQQAGLTIREVAKASGIPVSTAGDYFAARHLPPARQPDLLPSILAACRITDAQQVERWQDALNRVRRAPGRPPARPGTLPGAGQLPARGRRLVLRPRGVSAAPGAAGDRAWRAGAAAGGGRAVRVRQVLAAAGGPGSPVAGRHLSPAGRPAGGADHAGRHAGGGPGRAPGGAGLARVRGPTADRAAGPGAARGPGAACAAGHPGGRAARDHRGPA